MRRNESHTGRTIEWALRPLTMPSEDKLALVGTVVGDKYAIEAVVAEGGFATVYRATHLVWKRTFALKAIRTLSEFSTAQRERLVESFLLEGSVLANLSQRSPAICQAHDVGTITSPDGQSIPYIVLDWLEGVSLAAALDAERARGAMHTEWNPRSLLALALMVSGCSGTADRPHVDSTGRGAPPAGSPGGVSDAATATALQDASEVRSSPAAASGCSPANCAGCCAGATCVEGLANDACGVLGVPCVSCVASASVCKRGNCL